MSSINTEPLEMLEQHIGHIPYNFIGDLTRQLYTITPKNENSFAYLYKALCYQYTRQLITRTVSLQTVTNEIISKAKLINEQFSNRLKQLLENIKFVMLLRKKINFPDVVFQNQSGQKNKELFGSKPAEGVPAVVGLKTKTQFNLEIIKEPAQKNQNLPIINNKVQFQNKTFEICQILTKKPQCFCTPSKQIFKQDQDSFTCFHCNRVFHTVCMRKKSNSQFCSFCFLQKMVPVKKVVKTLCVALMKKGFRKHQITFFVPELEPTQKIQIRCLRLKESSQNFCLFPDSAQLSLNHQSCRQFEPINKQSCLKYRKDEPFYLLKNNYYPRQDNAMVVTEYISPNKQKEVRCEPQNHMIGAFIIEDVKIEDLIKEVEMNNTLGFSQSAQQLNNGFKLGKGDDQITCQLIKIPLLCPLTTVRIQIPVRGVFCSHFQCFDLKNYLVLISQSQNPRWKCPLCPCMAHELVIDSITKAIIEQTKSNDKIKQILFYKSGDYSAIIDDIPVQEKKNIRSLNIPERKREGPELIIEPPRKRNNFVMPENALVIDLD